MTPQQGLFSDDFVAYHVDRHGNMTLYEVDKNHFYSGHVLGEILITLVLGSFDWWLLGETRSSVAVHVSDSGVLTGTVAMDTEVYHFEVYGFYSGYVCVYVCLSALSRPKDLSTPHMIIT